MHFLSISFFKKKKKRGKKRSWVVFIFKRNTLWNAMPLLKSLCCFHTAESFKAETLQELLKVKKK
jgi:hypothetical protein